MLLGAAALTIAFPILLYVMASRRIRHVILLVGGFAGTMVALATIPAVVTMASLFEERLKKAAVGRLTSAAGVLLRRNPRTVAALIRRWVPDAGRYGKI